jgi:penicillin-binding protein 1A
MILGGLKHGVTPLEMAYAYSTLANGGNKISGTMASRGIGEGPVAIESVKDDDGELVPDSLGATGENEQIDNQVLDPAIAEQSKDILHTVVTSGTGKNAQVGDDYIWGKTGTTDGNIDAWFVGSNELVTAAVWIGYPDGATPMETEYGGSPVDGGTIPALLWADVIAAYDELYASRLAAKKDGEDVDTTTTESVPVTPTTTPAPVAPIEEAPAPAPEPAEEAPATPAAPAPDGGADGGAAPTG